MPLHNTRHGHIGHFFCMCISFNDDREECEEMKQTRWGCFIVLWKTGSTVLHHRASSDRSQKRRSSWTARAVLLFLQLTCGDSVPTSVFSITSLSFSPNHLISSRVNEPTSAMKASFSSFFHHPGHLYFFHLPTSPVPVHWLQFRLLMVMSSTFFSYTQT